MFIGSYREGEVDFLLKKIDMPSTSILEKEKLISKGKAHYSEMITLEKAPTQSYLDIYYENLKSNGVRFKKDIISLTKQISENYKDSKEIVLVSLARAGTPIGVLVHTFLPKLFNRKSVHYSVSIIRDRGIDENAILHILKSHSDKDIVFIDGWTGKGVITDELDFSINAFNIKHNTNISSNLYVVADISGKAYWAATHDDYLIPTAILNSTVSGLISRSILNSKYIFENDFHGCVFYENLKEYDISGQLIDYIVDLPIDDISPKIECSINELQEKSLNTIEHFMKLHSLSSRNYIKPGIGETTRVLLRRLPKEIWVKDINDKNILHIVHLCKEKCVMIHTDKNLAYNAVAIIEESD